MLLKPGRATAIFGAPHPHPYSFWSLIRPHPPKRTFRVYEWLFHEAAKGLPSLQNHELDTGLPQKESDLPAASMIVGGRAIFELPAFWEDRFSDKYKVWTFLGPSAQQVKLLLVGRFGLAF